MNKEWEAFLDGSWRIDPPTEEGLWALETESGEFMTVKAMFVGGELKAVISSKFSNSGLPIAAMTNGRWWSVPVPKLGE